MEPFEDDTLVSALESLRPAPRPAFAAELDERSAAGFPRRSGISPWRRLAAKLKAVEPRRALIPAGATALAAVAAMTVMVAVREDGTHRSNLSLGSTSAERTASPKGSGGQGQGSSFNGSGRYSPGGIQYGSALPRLSKPPTELESSSASSAGSVTSSAGEEHAELRSAEPGPYASQARHREIERSAQLVLGAEPAAVRKAASEVFEIVHAYRGIVLYSSIRDGGEGQAGARFALLIPSARLGDAMADFSGIGDVRSRREATADITAPTVRTGELLRDSRATIEGLLAQLAQADTDAERTATEVELRAERRHAAHLRSQLASLERRANLSQVRLRIESGASAASSDEGGWSIGDAVGDAGQILAIAAGVTILGLAVIGPFVLVGLLIWLANRARVKRARHRALA